MTHQFKLLVVIGCVTLLALPIGFTEASPAQVFYLHKWTLENPFEYLMDENAPVAYSTPLGLDYVSYYFRTSYISSEVAVEPSTWVISVWLGYTVMSTSLAVAVGYLSEGTFHAMAEGNITGIRQFPKRYDLGLSTDLFQIPAGGALALRLMPVRNTLIPDPNVVLYFDSAATASQVSVEPATSIPEFGCHVLLFAVIISFMILSSGAYRHGARQASISRS